MPLGIKGRFYASVPVLYLTGILYVKNFGAYSLMCNKHIKGRFYANLILRLISRVLHATDSGTAGLH